MKGVSPLHSYNWGLAHNWAYRLAFDSRKSIHGPLVNKSKFTKLGRSEGSPPQPAVRNLASFSKTLTPRTLFNTHSDEMDIVWTRTFDLLALQASTHWITAPWVVSERGINKHWPQLPDSLFTSANTSDRERRLSLKLRRSCLNETYPDVFVIHMRILLLFDYIT